MPDILNIPKNSSSFPPYLDFNKFKEAGIKHIESLGSKIWTDYNLHDPGITILEVLCYALTDLGYRTNFPIKELLTRSSTHKLQEVKKNAVGEAFDDNFFTPAEILTCNPVTFDDFRKLLIDIPGVRNAWIEKASDGETPIYLNKKQQLLQNELPPEGSESDRIKIRGLYDICIETEPLHFTDACGNDVFSENNILEEVYKVLNRHRNLCEDIREISLFGKEQLGICADIELSSTADADEVLLEINKQIEEFLSPTLRFYSLQEMLEKGSPIEEIFEGRPLTSKSHGFIDPKDLKKLDPKSRIYASDLYRIMMDIEGVRAVRNLSIANAIGGVRRTKGEKWCLPLTPKYLPHFDLDHSSITFLKDMLPFTADKNVVKKRYREEKVAGMKAYMDRYELDLSIPEGTHRDLEDYTSIMEEFPLTYGVGQEGIKGIFTSKRQAQTRQMKGYLLFFDQLLANYLGQLAHVRDLFSMRQDEDLLRQGRNRTYFVHLMKEVPGIEELVKNFVECSSNDDDAPPPEDYPTYLAYVAENVENYQKRRNRFLDHLLARFSESFADYVLLMFEVNGKRHDETRIIRDKASFLQSYPEISRNRGKGLDYTQPSEWCRENFSSQEETGNVSGLEKRVSKILGIEPIGSKKLAHSKVVEKNEGYGWIIKKDKENLLMGTKLWPTEKEACAALESTHQLIGDEKYYHRLTYQIINGQSMNEKYGFVIRDQAGNTLAKGNNRYDDPIQRDLDIFWLINQIRFPEITVESHQENECFFLELYDFTGETLLLTSQSGFKTAMDAYEFFDNPENEDDFLGWASKRENFEIFEKTGGFSFFLKDNNGNNSAISTHIYNTAQECEYRIQAVINYLENPDPLTEIEEETPGQFSFEISDEKEEVIWESVQPYATKRLVDRMASSVRSLSRHRIYYRTVDDPEGEFPHGFELLDRRGDTVATHPLWFLTDCERDLALEAVLYGSQNYEAQKKIVEENDGFQYELLSPSGQSMMKGIHIYSGQIEVEEAWKTFLELSLQSANYHLKDDVEGEYPFGFELLNTQKEVVAISSNFYSNQIESEMAMKAVINYLSHTEWHVKITGTVGIYHFKIKDQEHKILLNSIDTYPDEPSAKAALLQVMELAQDAQNYFLLDNHKFELRNEDDTPIAKHPESITDDAQRDAVINLIVNYLRKDAPRINTPNTGGAFYGQISDIQHIPILKGVKSHSKSEDALEEMDLLLKKAALPENYLPFESDKDRCKFSFSLVDENKNTIALHTQHYPKSSDRDKAMHAVFSLLTHGKALKEQIIEPIEHYNFELEDHQGNILFASQQTFGTETEATDIAQKFKAAAAEINSFESKFENGKYRIKIWIDEAKFSIYSKILFDTAQDLERAVEKISLFIRLNGKPYQLNEEADQWGFSLGNDSKLDFLQSEKTFERRNEAIDALINFSERAIEEANYRLLNTEKDNKEQFGFVLLDDRDEPASKELWFDTEEKRNNELSTYLGWLVNLKAEPSTVKLDNTYGFLWKDFEGNVIIKSSRSDYPSSEEAQAVWEEMAEVILKEEDISGVGLEYQNASCFYKAQIRVKGDIVAVAPKNFQSRTDAENWAKNLRHLLEKYELEKETLGTACGYYFTLRTLCHNGEESEVLIKSNQHFPTASEALKASLILSELLPDAEKYKTEEEDNFWRLTIRSNEKTPIATSDWLYKDEDAALAAKDCLQKAIKNVPELNCENDETIKIFHSNRSYSCQVAEDQSIYLESKENIPIGHIWPSNKIFHSRSTLEFKIKEVIKFFQSSPIIPEEVIFQDEDGKYQYNLNIEGIFFSSSKKFLDKNSALRKELNEMVRLGKERKNYKVIPTGDCSYSFELRDIALEEKACGHCSTIYERGQYIGNYHLITNEDECLYGFELGNGKGEVIATHPVYYDSAETREEALNKMKAFLKVEGFHLIEHLLLRPRRKALSQNYQFELFDTDKMIPFLKGVEDYDSKNSAEKGIKEMFRSLLKYKQGENQYIRKLDNIEDVCRYSFEILAEKTETEDSWHPIASLSGACSEASERDDALEILLNLTPEESEEIPELPSPFIVKINAVKFSEELIGDDLLEPVCDCGEEACDLSPQKSDPYSFRATVILPYWPERFFQPEFRSFVETTLRKEAPAHIFLRICWVEPCKMAAFEEAYCRWLAIKASGDDGCDASISLNRLIDILHRLKNIYPAATLHDCEEPTDNSNRVILNHSIIGSANPSSDEKSFE